MTQRKNDHVLRHILSHRLRNIILYRSTQVKLGTWQYIKYHWIVSNRTIIEKSNDILPDQEIRAFFIRSTSIHARASK